jgi:hypothetical protein
MNVAPDPRIIKVTIMGITTTTIMLIISTRHLFIDSKISIRRSRKGK